eukprot:TRINITY_DN1960_c0_g1_i1.p1 TRINITY_DN1960_c0_g1~~TRINITY_DN1960_c0_g1_i1.p1  ORF type:complete len:276 (+),score=73.05 TRINITY_DN1960_c0_g1_i1:94-828(+)
MTSSIRQNNRLTSLSDLGTAVSQLSQEILCEANVFNVAISGGSLPKLLMQSLDGKQDVEFGKWHVFFVDERLVGFDDDESTYKLVKEVMVDVVGIPDTQVHRIDPDLAVDECADNYEAQLREHFGDVQIPEFDLILLGMGPDGHTASLFPHHPLLKETERWIAPISDSPKPPPSRVTLTLPVINAGKNVVFVAAGASKQEMLQRIFTGDYEEGEIPSALVSPESELVWYVDEAAVPPVLKGASL